MIYRIRPTSNLFTVDEWSDIVLIEINKDEESIEGFIKKQGYVLRKSMELGDSGKSDNSMQGWSDMDGPINAVHNRLN